MNLVALDLDYDFVCHLAITESFTVIRNEKVSSELLEDADARGVYDFQLAHYRQHGKPATGSVIEHEFDQVSLQEPEASIGDLIDRLRERYARNEGRQSILNLTSQHANSPTDLASALMTEGKRLYEILIPRGEVFEADDYDKAIARYHKSVVQGRGASLGFDELDDFFYGQHGLTFMVGAPKSYKSWFTIQAVLKNIMDDKFPILYSLELPAEETDMRLRCLAAKIPYSRYLKHQLDKSDLQQLEEWAEILAEKRYRVEKPPQGARSVGYLVSHARDAGASSIFIDQLQYVETPAGPRSVAIGATNDTKDYFQAINELRDLSDDGPIWVVHQFNRSVMSADKMPDMQQIKGSAAVEECATLALGLWSNAEMRKSNVIQIGTLASRNTGYKAWEVQILMRTTCGMLLQGEVTE